MSCYQQWVSFCCLKIILLSSSTICSQSYNTSLGLRWGDGIGITARQRVLKRTSLEGIFYKHQKTDMTIAGVMVDHHMPVLTRRLNLYAGGGLGLAFPDIKTENNTSYKAVMINAGLEFTISRLNLSWDFVPVIPVTNNDQSLTTLTAFSLRYVLIKKNKNGLFGDNNKHHKKHKRKKKGRGRR